MKKNIFIFGLLTILFALSGCTGSSAAIKNPKGFDDVIILNENRIFVKNENKWGTIDNLGNYIVKPEFDKIYDSGGKFLIVEKDGKYGALDNSGKPVFDTEYDFMTRYCEKNNLFIVVKGGLYGLIDTNGKKIVSPKFEDISVINREVLIFKEGERYGLIKNDGTIISQAVFEETANIDGELTAVKSEGKWGFMDNNGSFTVAPAYANIIEPLDVSSESPIPVQINSVWGYVNKNGEFIIDPQFVEVHQFSEGLAPVAIDFYKWGYINTKGEMEIEPTFSSAGVFKDGFAAAGIKNEDKEDTVFGFRRNSKMGMINKKGEFIIPPLYYEVWITPVDINVETFDRKFGVYDKNLKCWLEPSNTEWVAFRPDEHVVKHIYFAEKGHQSGNDKIGYWDLEGNKIIPPDYTENELSEFSEGLVAAKIDGEWGYIDKSGSIAIKPQFDEAGFFKGGIAPVKQGDKWIFINKKGEPAF